MRITHKICMDLARPGSKPIVGAVQGEGNTRALEIDLYDKGVAWEPPTGATAAVAFQKPDGTRGLYDKLPNGDPATVISGSVVTAILAPQVLTCAGTVLASVVFYDADGDTLATFPFKITVEANPAAGQQISNNYYALQTMAQVNATYAEMLTHLERLMGSRGGMTETEKNLILTLFKNAAYTSADMGGVLTQLETLWNGSGDDTGGGDTHSHSYTSVITAATCTTDGKRVYTCSCGDSYTVKIPATGHNYVDGICTVCGAAGPTYNPDVTEPEEPEVTLTRISATYSGGSVFVGTAVSDLTGIVVTAHYSDDTSETVTGYTLYGTIAEGSNTITVSYGGKTTTFIVVGIADEPGVVVNPANEWRWTQNSDGSNILNRVTTTFDLVIGDVVDFSDNSLRDTYKLAIGAGEHSWNSSFYGGGYQAGAYTINVDGLHFVMVARIDNANIDADEMAYIADNVGYYHKS